MIGRVKNIFILFLLICDIQRKKSFILKDIFRHKIKFFPALSQQDPYFVTNEEESSNSGKY